MHIGYDLSENMEDLLLCETCGTFYDDYADLDTDAKTVTLTMSGCFGDFENTYTLQEFLSRYEYRNLWPEEPAQTLINDVKDMLSK